MLDGTLRLDLDATSKKVAAKAALTMRGLRRQAFWGAAAAAAVLVAVLSGRSSAGVQRVAAVLSSLSPGLSHPVQTVPHPFDAQSATRQLAQAVQGLREDRDRLTTRLAAVERNMEDVTGSIDRQIKAAKAESAQALQPWPNDQPAVPMTAASIAATVAPWPTAVAMQSSPDPLPPAAASSPPETAPSTAYGVEIGNGTSFKTLQTRWMELRWARAHLFRGLRPSVALRKNPRSNRTELRLVVGPLSNAEAAVQLCAALATLKKSCEPTMFDGGLSLQ